MLKKQNDKKPENPHTKTKTLTLMVLIFAVFAQNRENLYPRNV